MGYFKAGGQYADTADVTLKASAAVTASGVGSWIEVGDRGQARLTLTVTAVSGTSPTIDVEVETASDSSGTNNSTLGSFTQKAAAGSQRLIFHGIDRFVRVKYTLGGSASPSVTFSVSGEAV